MLDNSAWLVRLLPYLGGGLAGAIFNQLAQRLLAWWQRPILAADFGKDDDGSIVQEVLQSSGVPSAIRPTAIRQWIRIKIKNSGRSTAKNARVMIAAIDNRTSDQFGWKFSREVIDCWWSHLEEVTADIPPKTWRFVDLIVLNMTENDTDLRFTGQGARNIPGRIEDLRINVTITGENCRTKMAAIRLRYIGLLRGMSFY